MSSNVPVMKFKAGTVDVAVWNSRNGNYCATIRNQYRDKVTGEYKETKSWYIPELRHLLQQLKSAIDYMHEKQGNKQVSGRPIGEDFAAQKPKKYVEAGLDIPDIDTDDIPF